jgi:hypothetical protein
MVGLAQSGSRLLAAASVHGVCNIRSIFEVVFAPAEGRPPLVLCCQFIQALNTMKS